MAVEFYTVAVTILLKPASEEASVLTPLGREEVSGEFVAVSGIAEEFVAGVGVVDVFVVAAFVDEHGVRLFFCIFSPPDD